MSAGNYSRPIRPPRGGKTSKETGNLMSIINALSKSQDNADRDKEKKKLEKEFNDCDRKLNHLVEDHREDLSDIMQAFSKVHSNVDVSKSKCDEIKEMLKRSKKLLHCKRDELKRLWVQVVEHKRVLCMLREIESVVDSQEKIEALLKNKMYTEATELVVSSNLLLEQSLSGVDALKELKVELSGKQENLHNIIVQELHILLYTSSTSHVLNRFKRIGSGRLRNERQKTWADLDNEKTFNQSMKSPLNEILCTDVESVHNLESSQVSIDNLVDCVVCLHRIPETIEIVEERCERELIAIVRRTVKHVAESVQNITISFNCHSKNLKSVLNKEQENLLLDVFELIFEQFKSVLNCHKELLKKLYDTASRKTETSQFEHKYEMADIWSKMQTVLELFIGEYVDVNNFAAPNPVVPSSFANVPSAIDINSFFLRKKVQKPKNYALFKFDSSSHALSMKTYLQEQKEALRGKGEMDSFDSDTQIFICPPCHKNITTIFIPTSRFVTEIEDDLKISSGTRNGPLRTFIANCVKVFRNQVSVEIIDLALNACKSLQNWRIITDDEITSDSNELKQMLHSTVCIDNLLIELKDLTLALPKHASCFLYESCNVLQTYRNACQNEYSSLIQPHAEDKRIISSSWAKDSDISRLLRSLPNYKNLTESESSELNESPEEIRLRNKKESEILIANLSSGTFISPYEILSDPHHLHNLGLLHESLDWLSHRIMDFIDSLPKHSFETINTGEVDEDERCVIPENVVETLIQMRKDYANLADTCLLVLHLEVRVHCFYYLQPLANQSSHVTRLDIQEPDPEVLKLISDITKIDELLQSVIKSSNIKYVFEGLGDLIATILINSAGKIKRINENGIKKMIRNIFALQQNLTGITMSREVALDRARQYYDLLNHSPEEILNLIVESGPQFQELEYSAVFCLWHRSHPCADESATLSSYLERLHQILNEVAVSV